MSSNTILARTVLGDALRRLGDLVDGAPSLLTASRFQPSTSYLTIYLTSPDAVQQVGNDLGLPTLVWGVKTRWTEVDLPVGPVELRILAEGEPSHELHRPVDVTETIEEQER